MILFGGVFPVLKRDTHTFPLLPRFELNNQPLVRFINKMYIVGCFCWKNIASFISFLIILPLHKLTN